MKKINLTEDEIQVIKEQLNGEFGAFTATPKQMELIMSVTAKAEALINELDAYDELEDDLIEWFWNKYKEQDEQ